MTGRSAHHRCDDCLLTGAEHLADANWLSAAGATRGNPELVFDLVAADLWEQIGQLHDEGSR